MSRPRTARAPLNRDRVVRAAVELADEVGLDGVSMRMLASRLGVVPMALYKHVANKEELLDGMVDVVVGEFTSPEPSLVWKEEVRQRVMSARRAVLRHAWARRAVESRTRRTPAVLAHMDSIAGSFIAAGFSADLTHHVMHALGNRIWGFSPEMFDESKGESESPVDHRAQVELATEFTERYPHIVQIAVAANQRTLPGGAQGCDEQFEFEFALGLLLDGAERLHRLGWSSADAAPHDRG